MMADKDRIERDIFYSVLGLYQGRYYQVNKVGTAVAACTQEPSYLYYFS
ncbi:MAG: hypothetical protein K0R16_562 [Nitrososphaeraceae archaeon]|jgi:hypothetical protein|nr:hypothetical protein [Nitrososphaeraceae archaeon]